MNWSRLIESSKGSSIDSDKFLSIAVMILLEYAFISDRSCHHISFYQFLRNFQFEEGRGDDVKEVAVILLNAS